MSASTNPSTYSFEEGLMLEALAKDRGSIVRFKDKSPDESLSAATQLIFRLNNARKLSRKTNEGVYPEGDPMHGRSPYDELSFVKHFNDGNSKWEVHLKRGVISREEVDVEDL
jgi:hypothetical protein